MRKNRRAILERTEPFTKPEKAQYPLQKQNFIRGIQLRDGCKKDVAIKESNRYFLLPNKERKEFAKSVQKAILDDSPKRRKKRQPRTGEMKPIKFEQKELPIAKEQEFSRIYTRSEVFNKVENRLYSPQMNARMISAMKKYPNDTLYQWQHGHSASRR